MKKIYLINKFNKKFVFFNNGNNKHLNNIPKLSPLYNMGNTKKKRNRKYESRNKRRKLSNKHRRKERNCLRIRRLLIHFRYILRHSIVFITENIQSLLFYIHLFVIFDMDFFGGKNFKFCSSNLFLHRSFILDIYWTIFIQKSQYVRSESNIILSS